MSEERINEIHVAGMRTLASVRLDLHGLAVLIGENGSGKSSLIEACELLQRAAGESFADELQRVHGGVQALLRFGATKLTLGLRMDAGAWPLEYTFALREDGTVESESLTSGHRNEEYAADGVPPSQRDLPDVILERRDTVFKFRTDETDDALIERRIDARKLALASFGEFRPHWMMASMLRALRSIDVHLPFDASARWAQRSRGLPASLRSAGVIEPAGSLSRFGNNVASAYSTLKNEFSEAHWRDEGHRGSRPPPGSLALAERRRRARVPEPWGWSAEYTGTAPSAPASAPARASRKR